MPFVKLYKNVFPSIPNGVFREISGYLEENPHLEKWIYASDSLEHLAQGDIVEALTACFIDEEGATKSTKVPIPALLLSNTCDMSMDNNSPRKQTYTIVPLLLFNEDRYNPNKIRDIKSNVISDMLYLPSVPALGGSYIAQFDRACSVSSAYVHKQLLSQKRSSFSQRGYYFFMAKLSLHLTRPENEVKRIIS